MRLFVFAIGNAKKKFQKIFSLDLHFQYFLFSPKKMKFNRSFVIYFYYGAYLGLFLQFAEDGSGLF